MIDIAALRVAAGREVRHLLGEIDGSSGVWIVAAEGMPVAHARRNDVGSPENIALCASMAALGNSLAARSDTGNPRSLVLETSTCRWIMCGLPMPEPRWFVVVLTDRSSMLAWVLSRVAQASRRLSGR